MITLKQFLDNPSQATFDGYEPCYLDCVCWVASWFGLESIKAMMDQTKCIFTDYSLIELPKELLTLIIAWIVILSIPFGGFFILGTIAWVTRYQPKVLKPFVKKQREHLERMF